MRLDKGDWLAWGRIALWRQTRNELAFSESRAERDAEAAKRAQRERLETLLEIGSEEDFVAMVKAADPKITHERLLTLIEHFREVRRKRAKPGS